MPRYFFDTDDGLTSYRDDEGVELPDRIAARSSAMRTLPDIARDRLPVGDARTFVLRVRAECGTVIYTATLALTGEWHADTPAASFLRPR